MTTLPELFVVGYPERLVRDHAALVDAARDAGFSAEVVDPSRLAIDVRDGVTQVLVDGVPRAPAVALPRGVNRPWPFVRQVLTVWARAGVRVVPGVDAADRCADKLETARVLADAGVPIMATLGVLPGPGARVPAASGDAVLVTKPARSSKGQGVRAATSVATRADLARPHPLVDGLVDHQVVQPRATAWGVDHRVVVADGRVVAMTRRHGAPGAITTNTAGATVRDVHRPLVEAPEVAHVAIAAATALDLAFGGIDVIEHEGRPVVLEANAWPGLAAHVRGDQLARELVHLASTSADSLRARRMTRVA